MLIKNNEIYNWIKFYGCKTKQFSEKDKSKLMKSRLKGYWELNNQRTFPGSEPKLEQLPLSFKKKNLIYVSRKIELTDRTIQYLFIDSQRINKIQ